MAEYDLGDLIQVQATFTTAGSGLAIDPATVKVTWRDPNGESTTYTYPAAEIIKDAIGVYHANISALVSGTWHYAWDAYGTGQSAGEQEFEIRKRTTERPAAP